MSSRPDPRSGHRIFATKDFVYMIGGYSPSGRLDKTFTDVWRLNILTEKWRKCSLVKGLMPDCLASFSLVQTNHPNEVFVYGGTGVPFGNSASDDLYKINMSEDGEIQLQKSIITGEESLKPPRIYGHAMCFAQSYDEKQKTAASTTGYEYNIDVWKLQLSNNYLKTGTSVWESKLLTIRSHISSNQLITFGGGAPEFCAEFNYLLTFDLATETFVNLKTTPDKQHGYPEGRKCHAIVEYKREVYIIGGCKDRLLGSNSRRECKMTNDVWRLNLATKQWTKLNASLPQPVFFHSAAVTSEGCVYVFGGCTDVNSQSRTNKIFRMWLRPPTLRHLAMRALRKNYYYSQKRVDDMLLSNPNQVIRNLAVSKKYACPEKCL
uniref:Kelch domain-containing protein 10 n=1 Tax=Ditylenchus dipsaci TaxID=166011 RepID=A0A915EC35_9BILA